MSTSGPGIGYASYAEFEREELRPLRKVGFNTDDLEHEARFNPNREESAETETNELNFDA